MMIYLLYISTFTLCCMYRPLKDAPENYTTSEEDKTIAVQKTLKVGENHVCVCMYVCLSNRHVWEFFLVFLEGLGWLKGSSMGYVKPSVTCLRVKRAIQIHFDLI